MLSSNKPFFIVNVESVVRRGERYLLTVRSEQEAHAPDTLSFPGGKVKFSDTMQDTLEHALKRETRKKTGVRVKGLVYLGSNWFQTDDGAPVLDIVFLCNYVEGVAKALDSEELADVLWLMVAEVITHPKVPAWTRQSIEKAEKVGA